MYQTVEQAQRRYDECKEERIRLENIRNEYQGNFPSDGRPFQERLEEHQSRMADYNKQVEYAQNQENEARRDLEIARNNERTINRERIRGTREQNQLAEGYDNNETERLRAAHNRREDAWARDDFMDRTNEDNLQKEREERWKTAEYERQRERAEYLRERERLRGHEEGRTM